MSNQESNEQLAMLLVQQALDNARKLGFVVMSLTIESNDAHSTCPYMVKSVVNPVHPNGTQQNLHFITEDNFNKENY